MGSLQASLAVLTHSQHWRPLVGTGEPVFKPADKTMLGTDPIRRHAHLVDEE